MADTKPSVDCLVHCTDGKDTNYYEIAENESFLELVDFWLNVVKFPTVIKFRDLVDLMETAMKKRGEDQAYRVKRTCEKKN